MTLLTVLIGATPAAAAAPIGEAAPAGGDITAAVRSRPGTDARVTVDRIAVGWAFGTAVIPAPHTVGAYPRG